MAGLAAAAAGMSGYGFVGGPGMNYKMGATIMWMPVFFTVSYGMMMWLWGRRMRMLTEVVDIGTFPDLAYERFQSNGVRCLTAINLIFCVWAYLGCNLLAGGLVFSALFGMPVKVGAIVVLAVTVIYTYYGGMVGSIRVDAIQGALMLFSIIAAFYGFHCITGGFESATIAISSSELLGPTFADPIGSPTDIALPLVVAWTFVLALGAAGQPHVSTKLYALKSYRNLRSFGLVAGVGYGIAGFMYLLPGTAVLYLVATGKIAPLTVPDEAVFVFLGHLPPAISIVVFMGLLAAIMSTSSSFLVIGSGLITRDIPRSFGKPLIPKREVFWGRIALVILAAGSTAFGLFGGYLVALLGVLGLGTFVATSVPVAIGFLWGKASKEAAVIAEAVVFGMSIGVSIIYEKLLNRTCAGGVPGYTYIIIAAFILMILVSLFTKGAAGENMPEKMKLLFKHSE
jgi:sodium/proline symporter